MERSGRRRMYNSRVGSRTGAWSLLCEVHVLMSYVLRECLAHSECVDVFVISPYSGSKACGERWVAKRMGATTERAKGVQWRGCGAVDVRRGVWVGSSGAQGRDSG